MALPLEQIMIDAGPGCCLAACAEVWQFPLVALVTTDYDAQEHCSTGEGIEGGYLCVLREEQIHVISNIHAGHDGNKFAHYVYCLHIDDRHGWVPSATLAVREPTFDRLPVTDTRSETEIQDDVLEDVPIALFSTGNSPSGFAVIISAAQCIVYKVWNPPSPHMLAIDVLWSKKDNFIPAGNHNKGGQSANRFMRSREQKLLRWCKHVTEQLQHMIATHRPTYIVVGGAVVMRQQLFNQLQRCTACQGLLILNESLWAGQSKHATLQCLLDCTPLNGALSSSV